MSKNRYPKFKKDENGKIICRGCGGKIPKGRHTWCSGECYQKHEPSQVYSFVFKRGNYSCEKCGQPIKRDNSHIHHIIKFKDNGLTVAENLLLLCIPCHREEHKKKD